MSTAATEADRDGITIRVKDGVDLFLPQGTLRVFVGDWYCPKLFRVHERVEQEDWVAEPGDWYLWNHKRGSFGRSITPHLVLRSIAHAVAGSTTVDPFADANEAHWLERVLLETPEVIRLLAKTGTSLDELDEAQRLLREMLLDGPGMKKPLHAGKVQMQSRFLKAATLHDSIGRPNQGATAARLTPIQKIAQARRQELRAIARIVDPRRVPVLHEMARHMSVSADVLASVRQIKDRWNEDREASRSFYGNAGNVMKPMVDRPWRPMFDRCDADLREAWEAHGTSEGLEAIDRVIVSLELLPLYSELAGLDDRLSDNVSRKVRKPRLVERKAQEFDAIVTEIDMHMDHLPVKVTDRKVEALPGGDGILNAPVTPKVYRRLSRVKAAINRGSYNEAKRHMTQVLAAFGG